MDAGAPTDSGPTPLLVRQLRDATSEVGKEEELAKRAASGDEAAFDALVVLFTPRVFAVAFRMLKDRAEAEDLAQEVFVSLYHSLAGFRFESRLSTWIYRITKNRCLNRIKFLQRRHIGRHADIDDPTLGHNLSDAKSDAGNLLDPSAKLERAQLSSVLEEHLKKLPEEQRLLVVLRDLEDLSYEEIAEVAGLPIGTVKSRIHRARTALQKTLAPHLNRDSASCTTQTCTTQESFLQGLEDGPLGGLL
ncbi:MAG: sigma-70 family RNA polymerase sigma factor [Deltaproteobacteria bacterium]|nr:sigma-70 family RNA polymerase sigma factor [Deltaproteobacteria bacterium]